MEIHHRKRIAEGSKKYEPEGVLELSSRTVSKIVKRMLIDGVVGCSNCGWDEAVGDFHHIHGKKIENADSHKNLCYLCPNCHRLFHSGLLKIEDLENLEEFIGDLWKEYYYAYGGSLNPESNEKKKMKLKAFLEEKRKLKREDIEKKKELILNSGVDFKKLGWVTKIVPILRISGQKVGPWIKRNMPELYTVAYKRKGSVG